MHRRRRIHAYEKGGASQIAATETAPGHPVGGSRADLLDYMSDLLGELKSLSDKSACPTLSGRLALAHAEAVARRNDLTQQGRRPAEI